MARRDTLNISVAIPVFNEQLVVPELIKRTTAVLDKLPGGPHEIVCVDDGSTDDTLALLTEATIDQRLTVIQLSRNFGQQPAYAAALDHVTGDAVVLMDGDLQDPPEAIPQLLEKLQEGFDVVYAIRVNRKENALKRICYSAFYKLMRAISQTTLPVDSGDFSVIRRPVIEVLRQSSDRHRYLRGLRSWVGFRQVGIPIERDARAAGNAKYSLFGLLKLALDGIFSFSLLPLRLATYLGSVTILLAITYSLYTLYIKFFSSPELSPTGFPATVILVSFVAGVQLIFLGIQGEYMGRIFHEVQGRPPYIIQHVVRESKQWTENTQEFIDNSTRNTGGGGAVNGSSSALSISGTIGRHDQAITRSST
ncbi:MAG TPA: glycosyltransferase [Planctomycetaceae bacterium]|nr:glycosyltransferase [Planctomycetaceae bacterium]|tara:strand:+ start:319 stop:1413 length:1095 start_codon:yes stop_codon:yes gene_type:complete